LTVYSLK